MSAFKVIGTLPQRRQRTKFGDHVAFEGIYVGLIVEVAPDTDDAIVAYKDAGGKVSESTFAWSTLRVAEPR